MARHCCLSKVASIILKLCTQIDVEKRERFQKFKQQKIRTWEPHQKTQTRVEVLSHSTIRLETYPWIESAYTIGGNDRRTISQHKINLKHFSFLKSKVQLKYSIKRVEGEDWIMIKIIQICSWVKNREVTVWLCPYFLKILNTKTLPFETYKDRLTNVNERNKLERWQNGLASYL